MPFAQGSSRRGPIRPASPRVRLSLEALESRRVPAVLTYTAPSGNGPDEIVVKLNSSGNMVEIYDNGSRVAVRSLSSVDGVVITGAVGEVDTLIVESRQGAFFPRPVSFDGGAGSGDAVIADANADLTLTAAAISSSDGGSVTFTGTESVELRGGADHNTLSASGFAGSVALLGAGGNDTYVLQPGPAVTVTDYDGSITLDFRSSSQAITANIGTTYSLVFYSGGGYVTVNGQVTAIYGSALSDTYVDNTTIETLSITDPDGNDRYFLVPGSTIGITDSGGDDKLDFGTSTQPITADIGTTETIVTDPDGDVKFVGTLESVGGTTGDDVYKDGTTVEKLSIADPGGDDTYFLVPGSTIGITDSGGDDKLDFGTSTQPITAEIETTETIVTDADGDVYFVGTVETVVGTAGDDTFIDPTEQHLTLVGGEGNDTFDLDPRGPVTIVEKGAGRDTIKFDRFPGRVEGNLTTGKFRAIAGATEYEVVVTSGQLENFTGTDGADNVVGNAADNVLIGGAGNDVLDGGAGNDTYVVVPGGRDALIDASGRDTIDLSGAMAGVTLDMSRTNGSFQNVDVLGNQIALNGAIENVIGTARDDVFSGGSWDDMLLGMGGNDRLLGQMGNDILVGGNGNDELNGGSGLDILIGGSGADRINAGSGEDILIAGFTVYDGDLFALHAIRGEWTSTDSYETRVGNIRSGTGSLTGSGIRLTADGPNGTVENNDGAIDTLTGAQQLDWFFVFLGAPTADVITDNNQGEIVN